MDWNNDGKVDWKDDALYHMVINPDKNHETESSSSNAHKGNHQAPLLRVTQLGKAVLWLLAFLVVAFVFMGSDFDAIWNLIEIGFVVFLFAQWLDG